MASIPLDSARVLLSTSIGDAAAVTEVQLLPDRALGFVIDPEANRVHVLDGRYGHDGRAYCIHPTVVSRSVPKGAAASCPDGTTEVQRGALVPGDRPVALGLDPIQRRAVMLTRGGDLYQASADVLSDAPTEHLALDGGVAVEGLTLPVNNGHIAAHNGRIAIAAQGRLIVIDGTDITSTPLPGAAQDLVIDSNGVWVATDAGVWSEEHTVDAIGHSLVFWQDQWWLTQPDAGQILSLDDEVAIDAPDLAGPAATDPQSDVLHLATTTGLLRLAADTEARSVETPAEVLDLDINLAGEIVLLHPDASLTVMVDETAYSPTTPLDVFVTTFSERPKNSEDSVPCESTDEGPSISTFMDRAARNRALLDDLPAPIGMGITHALVQQAESCGETKRLKDLVDHPLTSPGILVHEEPSACTGDRSCHIEALEDMAALFTGSLTPTWTSGMSTHHELDINWVASIEDAGLPHRYVFFGMSLRPDVMHHTDLRAKDPWPISLGDQGRAWATGSAAKIADRDTTGGLWVYPGDDTPAFNLGGCDNLFLLECHALLRGGGVTIDADDVAVLDLLLHRAITEHTPANVRTWTFHLPDIGTYDFTEGCTEIDRVWSGDACGGAHLQAWLIDVDKRLVNAGLVRWTRPGDLEQP